MRHQLNKVEQKFKKLVYKESLQEWEQTRKLMLAKEDE